MSKHILAPFAALAAGSLLALTAAAQGTTQDTPRSDTGRPDTAHPDTARPDTAPKGDTDTGRQEPTRNANKGATSDLGARNQNRLEKPARIDQQLSQSVENGCTYSAHVKGTINPGRESAGAAASSAEQKLSSDLTITSVIHCPNATDLRSSERVASTNASRTEMLKALALHGTIISSASGQRCMYVPYLDLGADGKMTLGGVAHVCPSEKGSTTDQGAAPSGGANQGAPPQK